MKILLKIFLCEKEMDGIRFFTNICEGTTTNVIKTSSDLKLELDAPKVLSFELSRELDFKLEQSPNRRILNFNVQF